MPTWSNMASDSYLPYGRQQIDEDDIAAVVEVLKSDWLTTGPMVECFEQAVADYTGARYAVAVSSGTAALHAAMFAIGIGPGDEVILSPMTFVATANAIVYQGGTPVFVDVEEDTLLIDPSLIEAKITPNTKAIIAVDYAGQPCDYNALRAISDRYGLCLVADACHSLGAEYNGRKTGTLADLTVFSFHPVKPITTGEGGMVVTDLPEYAERMCRFRNHGIETTHHDRARCGTWRYEMHEPGMNYRLTDIQAALGLSQVGKIDSWINQRQKIAANYSDKLANQINLRVLKKCPETSHGFHLFVVFSDFRDELFQELRSAEIGCNVHYLPVHLQPWYRKASVCRADDCSVSEKAYDSILSLPIFPAMTERDVDRVVDIINSDFNR